MQLADFYPLVMTERFKEAGAFYVKWFAFSIVFEADWCVFLRSKGEPSFSLMFMHPDHPSRPPGKEAFREGALITLQVVDAKEVYDHVSKRGMEIHHPLTDEPWGQRRFMTRDPAGCWVDVVQQIEPASGFWERYNANVPTN